jgi:hypothetical protein
VSLCIAFCLGLELSITPKTGRQCVVTQSRFGCCVTQGEERFVSPASRGATSAQHFVNLLRCGTEVNGKMSQKLKTLRILKEIDENFRLRFKVARERKVY